MCDADPFTPGNQAEAIEPQISQMDADLNNQRRQ